MGSTSLWHSSYNFKDMAKLDHQQALEAVYAERVKKRGNYMSVPTALFIERIDVNSSGMGLPEAAFYLLNEKGEAELLRKADQPFSLLALSVHDEVWVTKDEYPAVKKYAEALILTAASSTKGLPVEERMQILRKSAILVVEDLFSNPSPANIERSTKVVSSFVYVMMKDPKAYLHLAKLSSHDPYPLQHSGGTAGNSIILARKIGIDNEKELQEVGMAGLLHDIGKVKVRKEIINKDGPLDETEWKEMREHSQAGYDIVKDNPTISERTKRAILEHHEDKNGTGYPQGLKHSELDIFSKIVCLADVFNALTTNRSYSKARSPFDAFQLMKAKLGHKIDEDLFKQMVMIYGGNFEGIEPL